MSKYNSSMKKGSVLAYIVEYLTKIKRIDGKREMTIFFLFGKYLHISMHKIISLSLDDGHGFLHLEHASRCFFICSRQYKKKPMYNFHIKFHKMKFKPQDPNIILGRMDSIYIVTI